MAELHDLISTGLNAALGVTFALSSLYLVLTLLAVAARRKQVPAPSAGGVLPTVTVQIPTYNEAAALNCAQRCLAFDYPPEKLQILIGDDSSDPDISARIADFAAANPRVTVCRRRNNAGFKPGNLNHMLSVTTGDFILVLDSDFLPEPDFLQRLVQPVVQDPSLAGVQAAWRILNSNQNLTTLLAAGIIHIIHIVILPLLERFMRTGVFCGSGELVRKDLLLQTGGWTPGALTEDVDYSLRVIAAGHRIAYIENLHAACEVPFKPRDLFRQQMRWAYGVMRAFMNHGKKLLRSRLAGVRTKLAAVCFAGGYIMVGGFLLTLLLGALNLLTGPDPVPAAGRHLLPETAVNFLFTSGMLVASLCASFIAGSSLRSLGKLVIASLTLGIILLFFVGKGLVQALFGLPMHWFMVRKNGNTLAAA